MFLILAVVRHVLIIAVSTSCALVVRGFPRFHMLLCCVVHVLYERDVLCSLLHSHFVSHFPQLYESSSVSLRCTCIVFSNAVLWFAVVATVSQRGIARPQGE